MAVFGVLGCVTSLLLMAAVAWMWLRQGAVVGVLRSNGERVDGLVVVVTEDPHFPDRHGERRHVLLPQAAGDRVPIDGDVATGHLDPLTPERNDPGEHALALRLDPQS